MTIRHGDAPTRKRNKRSLTPQGKHIADLVQGVNNTRALIEANADLAATGREASSSTVPATGRAGLTSQFGEVGLALLEARDAARRIRDIIGRLTEARPKVSTQHDEARRRPSRSEEAMPETVERRYNVRP